MPGQDHVTKNDLYRGNAMGFKSLLLKCVDATNLYPLFNRYTKNTATVFMIHSVTPAGVRRDGAIPADTLAGHFEYLKRNNYRVLSLREYVQALIRHEKTHKSVVFTVDDGYRDFYLNAFDVFKSFGYPATVFITSDFIEKKLFFWWDTIEYVFQTTSLGQVDLDFIEMGQARLGSDEDRARVTQSVIFYCKKLPNDEKLILIARLVKLLNVDISCQPQGIYEPLSWDEIRKMNKSGIDFFPHTKTHPILSRISLEQQAMELREPKSLIEDRLGARGDIFCYPNGGRDDFTDETIAILKSSGYIAAVMGVPGFDSTGKTQDLFRLKRFVMPTESLLFKQYVSGLERFKSGILG
jgi:peptidoglycan/xylan/chitin deacetylase (PgdA/CDA1 family)